MLTIGFVGFGLIGGSIAKAIKKNHTSEKVKVVVASRSLAPLLVAKEDGIVEEADTEITEKFRECDIIFLCTPVEKIGEYMGTIKPFLKEGAILSDVGSVKGYILKEAEKRDLLEYYIGGHPMAGSEKTGYANSSELILQNAYFAITPNEKTSDEKLTKYTKLVREMGAIPLVLDAGMHDRAVAGISHLPHLIASSLVNLIKQEDSEDGLMKRLAAGGFKDLTRVASSSDVMWSQICATNAEEISAILDKYIKALEEVKKNVDEKNSAKIGRMFVDSSEYRSTIGIENTKGALSAAYILYCELEDKMGALSEVTLLLSKNAISIKNIEIVHNREFTEGALCIAFYDEISFTRAKDVLEKNGHAIYR